VICMSVLFSEAELEMLSAEIDRQLQELLDLHAAIFSRGDESEGKGPLVKQQEMIESLTKEPMDSFMTKFGRAAKADVCDEDGMLHKQWQKWGDLENKEALERLGAVLVAMGFSGGMVSSLAVATIVVIVHIGLKAFCEDYGGSK
jgi:hypothetical protein